MAKDIGRKKKAEVSEKEKLCWSYRIRGMPFQKISEITGIPLRTVAHNCERAADKHHFAFMNNIQGYKKTQSAIIEKNAHEALEAWEKSKKIIKKTTKKFIPRSNAGDNSVVITEGQIEEQEQNGDVKFLKIYLECHDALCKLWGLNILVKDNDGHPVSWESMTMDERIKFFVSIPIAERLKIMKAMAESTKFA